MQSLVGSELFMLKGWLEEDSGVRGTKNGFSLHPS
jgi:hypothetical protein